jgi:hypothetical protein
MAAILVNVVASADMNSKGKVTVSHHRPGQALRTVVGSGSYTL